MNNLLNQAYLDVLAELSLFLDSSRYIVLGSMATLSYTYQIGYEREMHDLDLIVDKSQMNIIRDKLLAKGFTETTFIHPRMPFYKWLIKAAPNRYIRFEKNQIAIECHCTDFQIIDNNLSIDLYPNIQASVPIKCLAKGKYRNVEFTTVNVNLLYLIKNLLNNTLGYFVRYKSQQRQNDLSYLEKLVDTNEVKNINCNLNLRLWKLSLNFPFYLMKRNTKLIWR